MDNAKLDKLFGQLYGISAALEKASAALNALSDADKLDMTKLDETDLSMIALKRKDCAHLRYIVGDYIWHASEDLNEVIAAIEPEIDEESAEGGAE